MLQRAGGAAFHPEKGPNMSATIHTILLLTVPHDERRGRDGLAQACLDDAGSNRSFIFKYDVHGVIRITRLLSLIGRAQHR